jgi:hypothetical protein
VVTHWHRDHTQGLSDLVRECESAHVVFSDALRSEEFRNLLGVDEVSSASTSSLAEMRAVCDILRARKGRPIKWAIADRLLWRTLTAEVYALSPSDSTMMQAKKEIGSWLPSEGSPQRRFVCQDPNETCIVLSIRSDTRVLILGADLVAGGDQTKGWKAIVGSSIRPHPRGTCFKIPHHGSAGSHETLVWKDLLIPSPVAVLTPYRATANPIPTAKDVERLRKCTPNLYCAGSLSGLHGPRRASNVEKLTAKRLHVIDGHLGQVRARFPLSDSPTIEFFGSARKL